MAKMEKLTHHTIVKPSSAERVGTSGEVLLATGNLARKEENAAKTSVCSSTASTEETKWLPWLASLVEVVYLTRCQ